MLGHLSGFWKTLWTEKIVPFCLYVKTSQNNNYRETMIKRKGRDVELSCEGSHTGYLLGQLMIMEREFQTCGSQLGKLSLPLHTHTYPLCATLKLQEERVSIMGEIFDMNIHSLAYTGLLMDCPESKCVPYNFPWIEGNARHLHSDQVTIELCCLYKRELYIWSS